MPGAQRARGGAPKAREGGPSSSVERDVPGALSDELRVYRGIFNASLDAIAYIDPQGRYLEQNPAHQALLGYSDADLAGQTPAIHLGEDAFARVARALAEQGQYRGELVSLTKAGARVPIELAASTIRSDDGRVVGHVGIKRDLSRHQAAEGEMARRLEQVVALSRLTATVGRARDVAHVYEASLDALQAALGAERASVLLFDPDGVMRFKAWRGLSEAYRAAVEGHTPWTPDARDPPPVLVPDVQRDAGLAPYLDLFRAEGIRALGFFPLVHQGRLLGKFMLYHAGPHDFAEDEVRLAQTIATHVAYAIARRRADDALLESHNLLRAVAEGTHDAVFVKDLEGRYLMVNTACAAAWGLAPEDAVGKTDLDLYPAADAQTARAHDRQVAESGQSMDFEEVLGEGEERRVYLVTKGVYRDPAGRIAGTVGIARDITRRKRAEEELRASNDRLRELDELKTQFLNTVSHELRTPLTPIEIQLHLLRNDLGDMDPRRQKAFGILERNLGRLSLLVQDVLDVARLQSGRLQVAREPVDLREPLADVAETFEPLARQAGVSLAVAAPSALPVEGDAHRLAQVLFNLVGNAVKFTPGGGRVEVRAAVRDGEVVVEVRDSGPGLTADQRARLFQPFAQVHPDPAGDRGGSGLGLYISKGLVEEHGGRIWATSEGPGKGSTFAFALPARAG